MLNEATENGVLYQDSIVYKIKEVFGEEFIYVNENGNFAISRKVLNAFKKLRGDKFNWDRDDRAWKN